MIRAAVVVALAGCTVGDSGVVVGDHHRVTPAWSVSRHVFPGDSQADLARDLALAAELGAAFVRTDVWWYAVEPAPGVFDDAALAQYRWYAEEAHRHGLAVIAIASNAPGWAKALYDGGQRDAFTAAFGEYCEHVALTLGDLVDTYQLWNEPNNVVDFSDGDTDVALFLAGRAGLERGARAPVHTAINLLVDGHDGLFAHWEDDVGYYFDHGAGAAVDVIAIDHYPGTWSIGDWGGNIVDRLFAIGAEHGKAVAIYETGYATAPCSLPFHTEDAQVAWIGEQLPRLHAKLAAHHEVPFELVNWFKLDDRNTGDCFDPEDNFGVVHTDRTPKPAFAALRGQIASW